MPSEHNNVMLEGDTNPWRYLYQHNEVGFCSSLIRRLNLVKGSRSCLVTTKRTVIICTNIKRHLWEPHLYNEQEGYFLTWWSPGVR